MFVDVLYRKTTGDTNTTTASAVTVTERFPHSYISVGSFYFEIHDVHDVHIPGDM